MTADSEHYSTVHTFQHSLLVQLDRTEWKWIAIREEKEREKKSRFDTAGDVLSGSVSFAFFCLFFLYTSADGPPIILQREKDCCVLNKASKVKIRERVVVACLTALAFAVKQREPLLLHFQELLPSSGGFPFSLSLTFSVSRFSLLPLPSNKFHHCDHRLICSFSFSLGLWHSLRCIGLQSSQFAGGHCSVRFGVFARSTININSNPINLCLLLVF